MTVCTLSACDSSSRQGLTPWFPHMQVLLAAGPNSAAGLLCCWSALCWWSGLFCCDCHMCVCVCVFRSKAHWRRHRRRRAGHHRSGVHHYRVSFRSPASKHAQCCEASQKSPPSMCAVPCRGAMVRITLLAAGFVIGKHSYVIVHSQARNGFYGCNCQI